MEEAMQIYQDSVQMDQQTANNLFYEGGILVILGVPSDTDFGIDIKSWTTGNLFKGVKMIPPGFHFVHYSATSKFGDVAPRVGFFHIFEKSEIVVKQWDKDLESISSKPVPQETVSTIKDQIRSLDKYLGPYPYEMHEKWIGLTNQITPAIVERCTPACGFIRSALELEYSEFTDASKKSVPAVSLKRKRNARYSLDGQEEEILPDLKPVVGTELRLTPLLDKLYPDGATPTEITQHTLDSSYALEVLIAQMNDPMEVIGELQLAFVCFLSGQSLDAFEHWKKMVTLICRVDKAIPDRRPLFVQFFTTLEKQLDYVPEEMLCDIVASNNFVYQNLRRLFANVAMNSNIDGRLKSLCSRLQQRLTAKFMWGFNDLLEEKDDEAPVVVDIESKMSVA